jgi:hypothetical protein
MSVNEHPTKGKGWWQIRFRPNGYKGPQKVVPFCGTRANAVEKESVLRQSQFHQLECNSAGFMHEIDVDLKDSPFIYFIQQDKKGPIKIGFSANPIYRLRELQAGNPFKLKIVGIINNANTKLEIEMHNKFSHIRLCGEWFEPAKELTGFIKKYCRGDKEGQLRMLSAMVKGVLVNYPEITKELLISEVFK